MAKYYTLLRTTLIVVFSVFFPNVELLVASNNVKSVCDMSNLSKINNNIVVHILNCDQFVIFAIFQTDHLSWRNTFVGGK